MALYFMLNTDDYKGEQSQIGDIMQAFTNALYKSTGLSLDTYVGTTSEKISNFFAIQNMEYFTEEVLWKNLTDDEKVDKILEYIDRESGTERGELIIIDSYLFSTPKENEETILENILMRCNYEKIIAVFKDGNTNKSFLQHMSDKLNGKLEVNYSDEFHDRFWICNRTRGFLTGTSLNGLVKKYCSIQEIDNCDVDEIVRILTKEQVVQ